MAAGDDIFQQYRNAGDAGAAPPPAAPASAPSPASPAPAAPAAKPGAEDDIFQQYRANPPSTMPETPSGAAVASSSDKDEAYGMMAPAFAPGTTGRDIANAFVGGIYNVGADVARNLGVTPNPLPADVQATMAAHPYVTTAGNLLGGAAAAAPLTLGAEVAAPTIYGGIGLGGAGWVPTLARGAITGAGVGAVQNALAGDPQQDLLTRARIGAEWGGPLGLVGAGVGNALAPEAPAAATAPYVTGVNPLSPEIAARANVLPSYRAYVDPTKPFSYSAPSSGWPAGTSTWAQAPTSEVPWVTKPGVVAAAVAPTTADEALPIATRLLDKARASGADLQPEYVNKFIDKVTADAEPAGPGTAAVAGPSDPVAGMVQRLQELRDQPLSIKDVMGMDQELNARQRAAIRADPDLARRLGNLQDALRDQVDAATAADVGGGADGWNAFKDGRAAYSQYKKMQAVEDMKARADGTQNPTSSYKTAVNNFVNSPKARGWSDEEIAALKDSADRGVIGGALHLMGSRLLPHVAGAVGASIGGIPGFIAGEALAHFGGAGARSWANALQTSRFGQAMGVLGGGIPPNALLQP